MPQNVLWNGSAAFMLSGLYLKSLRCPKGDDRQEKEDV